MADYASSAEGDEREVDVDCVMCLGVAFHELQLMRVERHLTPGRRPLGNRTSTVADRRLLLGDVHTDPGQRVLYRPMGFQPALVPHQVLDVRRQVVSSSFLPLKIEPLFIPCHISAYL